MNMHKSISGAVLSAILGTTGIAWGQTQQPQKPLVGDAGIVFPPSAFPRGYVVTEADRQAAAAREKARTERVFSLEHDAAEALFRGQYALAEADARRALSGGGPGIGDEVLAEALAAQGKEQEALQQYQSMVDSGNVYPRVLIPYAQLLLKAKRWPEAVSAYNKAIPPLSNEDLDRIKRNTIDHDYLLRANSHFTATMPQPTELEIALHIARGIALEVNDAAGNYQGNKALEQFKQALQLSPKSDLANYYYGYGLQQIGRFAPAQAAYNTAVRIGNEGVKLAARKAIANMKKPS